MKRTIRITLFSGSLMTLGLSGCATQRPVTMAPPVAAPPAVAAPVQPGANNNVYDWRDVPKGQQVPINRAVFDQGGYQLYATSGETITVPFENQNMYVMKFGKTTGDMYFINDNGSPTLFVRDGAYLENAAAQGARWYPFPQNYAYSRPVYMGIAPSWGAYTSMGWYPGMNYYGGYWSYNPWSVGLAYAAMPGLMINIGGRPYYGWNSYSTYYRSNPTNRIVVNNSRGFNYSGVRRGSTGSFGSGRTSGAGFSAARPGGSGSFGRSAGSTGSFGRTAPGSGMSAARPKFGSSSFGSGSAGSRPGSSFGSGSTGSRPSSSFGSGSSGFGSSTRRSSGGSSFGSGSSGFSSSRPSSGGGSFGRSSSGGSSFGRSSGSSFGGGGRRR